jgi:PEGA domain
LTLVVTSTSKAPEAAQGPAVQMDPVTVAVISDPPGAELFVDSKGFGSTPKQFQLKPGSHSIQVVKAGYKGWSMKLIVEEDAPTTVTAKLEK